MRTEERASATIAASPERGADAPPHDACICLLETAPDNRAYASPWLQLQPQLQSAAARRNLWVRMTATGHRCWLLTGPAADAGPSPLDQTAADLTARLQAEWRARCSAQPVWAGISAPYSNAGSGPVAAARARREALTALRLCRGANAQGGLLRFRQLGAHRFLLALPEHELQHLAREFIAPLAASDGQPDPSLINTLEAYLAHGGNVSRTAERLYVHRNTVLYRLQRLGELLGRDLHDPETRTGLHLALLAHSLLNQPPDKQAPADARPGPAGA